MSSLTVTVSMPGATQATQQMTALDAAATKGAASMDRAAVAVQRAGVAAKAGGDAWDALAHKMRAGEFLRNATASFALMSTAGATATDKIAALGASLSSLPGPVGAAAAGMTIAATAFGIFSKAADTAVESANAAAAALKQVQAARSDALVALGGRISGAAGSIGQDMRAAFSSGFDEDQRRRLASLTPGNPSASYANAVALSRSGLDQDGQAQVEKTLADARAAGYDITDTVVANAIASVQARAAAMAPLDSMEAARIRLARRQYAERGGGIFGPNAPSIRPGMEMDTSATRVAEAVAGPNAGADAFMEAQRRALGSRSGAARAIDAILRDAEAVSVQAGQNTIDMATGAGRTIGAEAIRESLSKNVDGMASLEASIRRLDQSIRDAQSEAQRTADRASAGWVQALSSNPRMY